MSATYLRSFACRVLASTLAPRLHYDSHCTTCRIQSRAGRALTSPAIDAETPARLLRDSESLAWPFTEILAVPKLYNGITCF